MKRQLATAAILLASGAYTLPAHAQTAASAPRSFAGVNDMVIACPPPAARSAEQLAAQFETRPRNLDEMSANAKRFMDPANPIGAGFREKRDAQFRTDWAFLCRYREANAALKDSGVRPRVVFMGDSITEGWVEARPDFFSGHGFAGRGISGQSSSQMIARFYADVVALRPQAVHIMTGTNDIGGATGPITEEEYVYNVRAMIDVAKANGIGVVLAAIPPMSRLMPRPEFNVRPVVLALNRRLKAIADETGAVFVDYYAPLADGEGAFDPRFANDGVHPTRAGYVVMERLAEQAIGKAIPPTKP